MHQSLALGLTLLLALTAPATVAAQWKPEVKFIEIGVSSAGGDWFRAGAKFSTMIPAVLPEVASSTVIGGGVVNVTRIGKGETQMGFALTPYPEQGYKGESKHYPVPFKNFGAFKVDRDGFQIAHETLIIQWQDGKKVIVWPEELAPGKPRFLTPPWSQRP